MLLTTEPFQKIDGEGPDASYECSSLAPDEDLNGHEEHIPVVLFRYNFFHESRLGRLMALQHEFVHLYGRDHTETWAYDDDTFSRYERRFPQQAARVEMLRDWKRGTYSSLEYLKQGLPVCPCTVARRQDLAQL